MGNQIHCYGHWISVNHKYVASIVDKHQSPLVQSGRVNVFKDPLSLSLHLNLIVEYIYIYESVELRYGGNSRDTETFGYGRGRWLDVGCRIKEVGRGQCPKMCQQ